MPGLYGKNSENRIFKKIVKKGRKFEGKGVITTVLMGTYLEVREDAEAEEKGFLKVEAFKKTGYIAKSDTKKRKDLCIGFIDCGQGDAALVETDDKRLLIDAGPIAIIKKGFRVRIDTRSSVSDYLTKYKYKWAIENNKKIELDVCISHFDMDHYGGLLPILKSKHFVIKNLYHNGIMRFHSKKKPKGYTDLGKVEKLENGKFLTHSFDSIEDIEELLKKYKKNLPFLFKAFWYAILKAHKEGRLGQVKRLSIEDAYIPGYEANKRLTMEVLGPIPYDLEGKVVFPYWKDEAHTINGHSVVLRAEYGNQSVLFSGDLNIPSGEALVEYYRGTKALQANFFKACHHGSHEFDPGFFKEVGAMGTVVSSGDNESHSHPRADFMGTMGKSMVGERPVLFSTELSRSYRIEWKDTKVIEGTTTVVKRIPAVDIHYGQINYRTNGREAFVSQLKESKRWSRGPWDTYSLPHKLKKGH